MGRARAHIVVLAAGHGRRMGCPKHLIEIDRTEPGGARRRTLLGHVLASAIATPDVGVYCVLATGDVRGAAIARAAGIAVAHPAAAETGRAGSIRAGIGATADASGWLFALADQPLLLAEDFAALLGAWREAGQRIAHASYAGQRGSPVVFGATFAEALLGLRDGQGGRIVLQRHADSAVGVALPAERGRDFDRPEDLPADATPPPSPGP